MASTREVAANVQVTGVLDMREHRITGMITNTTIYPTQDDEGATKIYVDEQRDKIIAELPNTVNNGTF